MRYSPIRVPALAKAAALGCAIALSSVAAIAPAAAQRAANVDSGGRTEVSRRIVLPLNKAAIVELPQAASDVLVSQPSIVDAVVRSPRRVYLLGQAVGQANAFFFDAEGRQILNLEIQVSRDIEALRALYDRLMPESRITVEALDDTIILRGVVPTSVQATNAADIAVRFAGGDADRVISMVSVRDREQVMLKVRIVEMQRQLTKQLGVNTSGTVALNDVALQLAAINSVAATGGLTGAAAIDNIGSQNRGALDVSLQALESNGLIRTLAEPNLTAVSGESANFLAGGEFPVPVGQQDGVITVEFKEFGVGLGFTPLVIDKGNISLKISTESSEITNANAFFAPGAITVDPTTGQPITTAGLSIPGLSVRRANTTVELPSGGSLAIAGLLQEDLRQTIQGVPGLKEAPVLGQLFRSRDFEKGETELVIIVTPYIVEPKHESAFTDPAKGFVSASDMQTFMLGKLASTYGLAGAGVSEKTLQGPLGFILD